jgi:hypothetical protein
MTPEAAYNRADAGIFLALLATQAGEGRMEEGEGLTWPQIRYWGVALVLGGCGRRRQSRSMGGE